MIRKIWNPVFEDGALIPSDLAGGAISKYGDDVFDKSTSAGTYLGRLQLMTSNSNLCKSGKFPINHYAYVSDQNFEDVGKQVDVLVIDWRPKALEMDEEILTVFDLEHDEFKRIQAKSEIKDSGCMYGPEFLVWIPSIKKFATFFMGTKSSRRDAPNLKARMQKAATLDSRLIETKRYTWQSPDIKACNSEFEIPDKEDMIEQVQAFLNPPETEVEKVEEGTARDR